MKKPVFIYVLMAVVIILACFALFSLDKDTHSFSDLFKTVNIAALIIYFMPSFVICSILYNLFLLRKNKKYSLTLALSTGIPLSFTFLILLLSAAMQ